jgi:hypothetical protein
MKKLLSTMLLVLISVVGQGQTTVKGYEVAK